jgi:hypothetical protein
MRYHGTLDEKGFRTAYVHNVKHNCKETVGETKLRYYQKMKSKFEKSVKI